MKKILGVIVLGLLWANTSFANDHKPNNFDAFVWSDGKKLEIQKGRDIENPERIATAYVKGLTAGSKKKAAKNLAGIID